MSRILPIFTLLVILASAIALIAPLSSLVDAKKYQSIASVSSSSSSSSITVAATQFYPTTTGANAISNIQQTAMRAVQFVFQTLSRQNYDLDLQVFPEFLFLGALGDLGATGVCSGDGTNSSGQLREYCFPVPDTNTPLLCNLNSIYTNSPANLVGCPLANSTLTVSINVCELMQNGTLYNTQVVLNGGRVVAKYRKFHPFFESCFKKPNLELVTFTVKNDNFKFGIFTCFDILFKDPKMDLVAMGIKYFSYSVAIPIVGIEAVKLFSWENGVTVVNSNADGGQSGVVVKGTTVAGCDNNKDSCAAVYTLQQ